MSRVMVAWQPIGISMGVFDMCHRYLKERKQFGAPLAAFQLNQEKLVQMLGNIQAMVLIGWRLCKLYESGKMTSGHSSLGKVCCNKAAMVERFPHVEPHDVFSIGVFPVQCTDSN